MIGVRGMIMYLLFQILANLVIELKLLLNLLKLLVRRFSGIRDDVEVRWWGSKAKNTTGS